LRDALKDEQAVIMNNRINNICKTNFTLGWILTELLKL